MPQLILEYSENIVEKNQFAELFLECHQLLATMLPTQIDGCKSRAVERSIYFIGDGIPNQAFVHVNLQVLAGRSEQRLQEIGQQLLAVLHKHFFASTEKLKLQITLEISELAKTYFKFA